MQNPQVWIAGIALLITFSTFLATVIFNSGRLTARLDALERRAERADQNMNNISSKVDDMASRLNQVKTLIEERTERRATSRSFVSEEQS